MSHLVGWIFWISRYWFCRLDVLNFQVLVLTYLSMKDGFIGFMKFIIIIFHINITKLYLHWAFGTTFKCLFVCLFVCFLLFLFIKKIDFRFERYFQNQQKTHFCPNVSYNLLVFKTYAFFWFKKYLLFLNKCVKQVQDQTTFEII